MAYLDARVVIDPGQGDKIAALLARFNAALQELGDIMAKRIETLAKTSRTWTDRTSHARQGLTARAVLESGRLVIYLFHQVYYGIFLELANAGKYAVIMRTLQAMYPQVMRMVQRLISGG